MTKHVVGTVGEIPPGGRKVVEVSGRSIGIFNLGGEFFALRNRCPHQGAALCEGPAGSRVQSGAPGEYAMSGPGEIIRCPWHGWEFDIRTGRSWVDPESIRVKAYAVHVVAETYAVSIEQNQVVIEL